MGPRFLRLVKNGIGNLTLTADNSMTGGVIVNAGALTLAAGGKLDHVGAVTIAGAPGTLAVTGGSLTASAHRTCTMPTAFRRLSVTSGTANFNAGLNANGNANSGFLINVSGGTLNASSISMGRSTENFGAPATPISASGVPPITPLVGAGATGTGLYIQSGTVNITGDLAMGTNTNANSTVSTRIDGGSLTVGGVTTIGLNNAGRWSVLDVNSGGTFTSTNTATGVQVGLHHRWLFGVSWSAAPALPMSRRFNSDR